MYGDELRNITQSSFSNRTNVRSSYFKEIVVITGVKNNVHYIFSVKHDV
jgi:hypothetical protein